MSFLFFFFSPACSGPNYHSAPWWQQVWCHLWLAWFTSHQEAPARAGQNVPHPPRFIYSSRINPCETAQDCHPIQTVTTTWKLNPISLLLWQISLRSLWGFLSSIGYQGDIHAAAFEFAEHSKATRKMHKTATPGRTSWSKTWICKYFFPAFVTPVHGVNSSVPLWHLYAFMQPAEKVSLKISTSGVFKYILTTT